MRAFVLDVYQGKKIDEYGYICFVLIITVPLALNIIFVYWGNSSTEKRKALAFIGVAYVGLNIVAPVLIGEHFLLEPGQDWQKEFVALVILILLSRIIDLWPFGLWKLAKELWE